MTTDTIRYIPLDKLVLSPKNTRKTRDPEAVEQMAASIAAQGLLQNLTVEPSANDPDVFEVIAGGTRLAALQQMQRDHVHGNVPVPCRVVTNGAAIEASAAENLVRTRLAPADEFDAFKAMAENGRSRAEIAQHFGVPEIVVTRSLKLANVDPKLVQVFREGGMNLEQLQALSVTDDHEEQRKAWYGPKYDHERAAWQIRTRLTQRDVRSNSEIARFVGIEAYQEAGGKVRSDLFGNDTWLIDRTLLESLAMDRLELIAQSLRTDGWSWVETHLHLDYSQQSEYPIGFGDDLCKFPEPTREQSLRTTAITERLQAIADEGDAGVDDETYNKLLEEQDDLETELQKLEAERHPVWPEHVMQQAGCLVTIDAGAPCIVWARLRPGQKVSTDGAVTGKAKPTTADKAASAKPKTPTLSGDMQERLHLHQRAATRLAISKDANLAIELLLTQLLCDLVGNGSASSRPFAMHFVHHHKADIDGKAVKFADVKASPARKALDIALADLKRELPRKPSDVQAWLAGRTVDQLHGLLALIAAATFDPSRQAAAAVAATAKIDMADYWQADAEHYLSHVPKALIAEAVRDVHGKDVAAKVGAMKVAPAVAEAAKLMAGARWLPKPLRGDGYKHVKPGKADVSKKAPPAKKATGKKSDSAKPVAKKAAAKKAPAKKAAGKKAAKAAAA